MQIYVEQLERQAAEKAAEEQRRNNPCSIVSGELRKLWQRAHEATQKIPRLQEKARPYRKAFAIIGVSHRLFDAPAPHGIPENPPCGWTVANYEACITEATLKVEATEDQAASLGHHVSSWERMTPDQQLWQALFALSAEVADLRQPRPASVPKAANARRRL